MEYTLQPTKQLSSIEKVQPSTTTTAIKEHQKEVEVKEASVSKKDLKNLLKSLNEMPILNDKLSFGFSDEIGQLLVLITDKKTEDIIRQYPTEEFINRLMYYRDNIGVLFDETV